MDIKATQHNMCHYEDEFSDFHLKNKPMEREEINNELFTVREEPPVSGETPECLERSIPEGSQTRTREKEMQKAPTRTSAALSLLEKEESSKA